MQHPFFEKINWNDLMQKKISPPLPKPNIKKILKQEIGLDKIYGRGAFDEALKDQNRVKEWSFIHKKI
jgi:hypothetical protein